VRFFISPYLLHANARVLHTHPLSSLRAGLPMLAATVLATIAVLALPHAFRRPGSPVRSSRFGCSSLWASAPSAPLLAAAPAGLFGKARIGTALQR
jgi:hypothetical protein